jgi:hypothetical protein
VAHTHHPSYSGGINKRIEVQSSLGKKKVRPYLKKITQEKEWEFGA